MKNTKCKVVHSQSKPAWNVVGTQLGGPYKLVRVPYALAPTMPDVGRANRIEAFDIAEFICRCLNKAELISDYLRQPSSDLKPIE